MFLKSYSLLFLQCVIQKKLSIVLSWLTWVHCHMSYMELKMKCKEQFIIVILLDLIKASISVSWLPCETLSSGLITLE